MRGRTQSGFTLLELVLVMIALTVLAAYALPRWTLGNSTVNAQAAQVARDIRHVQMLALSQGRTLTFQSLGSGYRAVDSGSVVIRDPATQQLFNVGLQNGNTLSAGNISFDSLGRPVSGGSLIAGTSTYTISGPSRSAQVTVAPVTGFTAVTP